MFKKIFYFWLRWVFVAALRLSLAAVKGTALYCGDRLLMAVTSLAAEQGPKAQGLQWLPCADSRASRLH